MPLYEVHHASPLTLSQKDALASAITNLHATKFSTPKMFVNVAFSDVSQSDTYIGGERSRANHIRAHVRAGPSRTREDWEDLCAGIAGAWEKIAGTPLPRSKGRPEHADTKLRSVIVMGGILGGLEAGFALPAAGGDVEWLGQHWEAFSERAEGGDQEFKAMVEEVRERGLLDGTGGMRTAQQKLEEMLGWGDAA